MLELWDSGVGWVEPERCLALQTQGEGSRWEHSAQQSCGCAVGGLGCISEFIVQSRWRPSDRSESRRVLSLDAHAFCSRCIRLQTESFEIHARELQVAAAGACSAEGISEAKLCAGMDGDQLGWMDGWIAGIPAR